MRSIFVTEEEEKRRAEKYRQVERIVFDGSCTLSDILDVLESIKREAKEIANRDLILHKEFI